MQEYPNIQLSKNDEYFLAIAKQGVHSFIMLGVIKDHELHLLGRVGKQGIGLPTITDIIGRGIQARLADEDISRDTDKYDAITYQAYGINYEQTKEFIALIAEVDKKQLEYYKGCDRIQLSNIPKKITFDTVKKHIGQRDALIVIEQSIYFVDYGDRSVSKLRQLNDENFEMANDEHFKQAYKNILFNCPKQLTAVVKEQIVTLLPNKTNYLIPEIEAYVPTQEEDDAVTFEYKKIKEFTLLPENACKKVDSITEGVKKLHVRNTCRTSAIDIVEAITGFSPAVSKKYFIEPKYKTTLEGGKPNQASFYIFPAPPTAYNNLSKKQLEVLKKLYKRLEALPEINTSSQETRDKFNALKTTYQAIAGLNKLSATQLLETIGEHESNKKNALFDKRSPGFFSQCFSTKSTTENLFNTIKNDLNKQKSQDEKNKKNELN